MLLPARVWVPLPALVMPMVPALTPLFLLRMMPLNEKFAVLLSVSTELKLKSASSCVFSITPWPVKSDTPAMVSVTFAPVEGAVNPFILKCALRPEAASNQIAVLSAI